MKRDSDKAEKEFLQTAAGRMIAPGVRVVRGPDWIWQNQGEFERNFYFTWTNCVGERGRGKKGQTCK